MKFTINRVVLVVLMAFAFWFFWVVEPAENLEHRYVLGFRNLLMIFMGFYYYFFFRWSESFSYEETETTSSWTDFRLLLREFPPLALMIGYLAIHMLTMIQVGTNVDFMVLDVFLYSLQMVFFLYLVARANRLLKKDSATSILLMAILINLGNTLSNQSIYFLFNPFGGFIYAIHYVGEEHRLVQYTFIALMSGGMVWLLANLKKRHKELEATSEVASNHCDTQP